MSTTGLTEKLTLALNSKNAIKSTLVDRAAIEEAAPFTAYAGAIENIGAEMPDIASWIEYDLPVEMNQPGKYTADAEHIFFSNQNSVNTNNAGLWMFNSVTGETKRLYDKQNYWKNFIWLNDKKLLIYTNSTAAGIYNFETETFEIILESGLSKVAELKNHYVLTNSGNVAHTFIIEKDTLKIIDLGNFWDNNWAVSYTSDTHIIITGSSAKPFLINLTTYESQQLNIPSANYHKFVDINDNLILDTSSSSGSSSLGIWIIDKTTAECKQIYTEGYYWNNIVVLDDVVLIRSQKTKGLLKYAIGDETATMFMEEALANEYPNMCTTNEGAAIWYCGGNCYFYNKETDSLSIMDDWTNTNYFKSKELDNYAVVLGSGTTTTNYIFDKTTNTMRSFGYMGLTFNVLPTTYGHIVYGIKDGVRIVKYDENSQTIGWKTLGAGNQSRVLYSTFIETDTDYYIWSTETLTGANIVRVSKADYEDCALILNSEHTGKYLQSAKVIDNKIYFCGRLIFVYDIDTKTYEAITNDFLGTDTLYLSYEKDTYNNFNFTDLQGIMSMETKQVSTIPFRTFLWRNYTFDLYGVTNINNGQQYQFKHPYERNTYGFVDYNYHPNSSNKVINNTNILTGICSGAIVVCNKEV